MSEATWGLAIWLMACSQGPIEGSTDDADVASSSVAGTGPAPPPERLAVAPGSATRGGAGRPNLLVIDIDSLAADRVSAERDGRSITPVLDALAGRGLSFERAYSQSGWTLPAISSLLTGRHPILLQVQAQDIAWRPAGSRDLAEILAMYGYDTAAFWGRSVPGPMSRSLLGSFAHVDDSEHLARYEFGAPVTRWITEQAQEPFFALVHEIDLHIADQDVAGGDPRRYADPALAVRGGNYYQAIFAELEARVGSEQAAEQAVARYDALLNSYDDVVGHILAAVDARGATERTVVVVTSDHGEDLFHHALGDHGHLCDCVLRIPLIVVDPRKAASPRVSSDLVQTVDLAPTLLEAAGVPVDATMIGTSLVPLLDGASLADRPVFSLTNRCNASLRDGNFKLVIRDRVPANVTRKLPGEGGAPRAAANLPDFLAAHGLDPARAPVCGDGKPHKSRQSGGVSPYTSTGRTDLVLVDLAADPGEYHDVSGEQPDEAVAMLVRLLDWLDAREVERSAAAREPITPEQRALLQDRGYWGLVGDEPGGKRPSAGLNGIGGGGAGSR